MLVTPKLLFVLVYKIRCYDGFELLKALRASARTKEVPIILLSARAEEESVIEGLQAGADDYLIKPFSATELVTLTLVLFSCLGMFNHFPSDTMAI